jgi:hypothetical protein
MATNQTYDRAESLSAPVADNTLVGKPVLVGALPGTTRTAEGEGGNPNLFATVDFVGAYVHDVTGAVATWGLPIYITPGGALDIASSGNTLWGYSLGTKGAGTGPLLVRPARV